MTMLCSVHRFKSDLGRFQFIENRLSFSHIGDFVECPIDSVYLVSENLLYRMLNL